MAARLGMSVACFEARHVREVADPRSGEMRRSLREVEGGGGRCSLLEGRNTCVVYEARPEHCRRFPFWDSVLNTREGFENARSTCPGIAVIVGEELRACAAERLSLLYRQLEQLHPPQGLPCCLEVDPDALWACGMEADALRQGGGEGEGTQGGNKSGLRSGCSLGDARPLACRLRQCGVSKAEAEQWQQRLRGIERELEYPASYARWVDLLRSRE
jgi:Fe-S-cluster containining protein